MTVRALCSLILLPTSFATKLQVAGEVSSRRSSEALLIAINAEEEPQSVESAVTHLLATGSDASATAGFNAVTSSLCQWYDSEHQVAVGTQEQMASACRSKCGLSKVKADSRIQAFTVNRVNDKKAYCTCSSRNDCSDYLQCPNCVSYIMKLGFWPFASDSETSANTTAAPHADEKTVNTTAAPHADEKTVKEAAPPVEEKTEQAKDVPTTEAPHSEEKTTTTEAATTHADTTSAEPSSFVNAKTNLRHKKSHKKKHSHKAHQKHGSKNKK
jgi:hypothetical protein